MADLNTIKEAKGLKFCHVNVCSLINKIDQFRLHFENSGIDIITVSETWLDKNIGSNILQMKNYQLSRCDRATMLEGREVTKKGGGLLTYISKDLNFAPTVNVLKNISVYRIL